MNAKKVNEQSECLHLVFIDQVFLSKDCFGGVKGHGSIDEDYLVPLPDCPVCLEKLNGSLTGLTSPLVNFLISTEDPRKERWGFQRLECLSCQAQLEFGLESTRENEANQPSTVKCNGLNCKERADLWVCLNCGDIGCSRYKAGHAVSHYCSTGHAYTLELKSSRIWDYERDGYVHRLLRGSGKEASEVLILPEETAEQELTQAGALSSRLNEKYLAERAEALVLQYNCLMSQQIEEMRKKHEEQLQRTKLEFEKSEEFATLKKTEEQVEAEFTRVFEEEEAIEKELKELLKKNKIMSEKKKQTEARIEEIRSLTSLLLSGDNQEEEKGVDSEIMKLKGEIEKQKQLNESLMRKL